MDYNLFLMPFLFAFVVAVIILTAIILGSKRRSLSDKRTGQRHIHRKEISRFGGIAMITSFVVVILVNDKLLIDTRLLGVLVAGGLILLFGIIDDVKQISWKPQLFFQIAIVVLVHVMGVKLAFMTNPLGGIFLFNGMAGYLLGFVISIIWVTFLMNAMNWVDGIDGAAGGVSLIGIFAIFFLSLRPEVNQPPVAIIAAVIIGGLVAFLLFNFNPAKIMAGTSGSMFMGFMLAILAIFAGAKIATTLLVLTVPIIDALWVIIQRVKAHQSIFLADKKHLHFRLLELGWTQKEICFFYYAITAIVAFIALNTHALGKVITFVFLAILIVGILLGINKKTTKEL